MTTISSSTTAGITLSSPSYVNPIVVNPGVSVSGIGVAIYASSGFWTIQNNGTISSAEAIELLAGGSVTNAAAGSIKGTLVGVAIYNSAGTVVNSGGISATNVTFGRGVYLGSGGSVTNAASASIRGGSGTAAAAIGVDLGAAGSVTNAVSASIAGGHFGVYIDGAGTVANSGTILGTSTVGTGVDLAAGGSVTGNSANDTFVVYNSADLVLPKSGSHDIVYSAVNYTLPTGVDSLILEGAATQAVGNNDASGDTLYAANVAIAQTLTGHSHNDTFVVYNSGDTVIGQASSTDTVYAAANFTLPTNVDTLFLEGNASHGIGNSDANNALFGNGGVASTLVGGSGADTLYVTGAAGTILTGGTGHDTFAFPDVMGHDEVTNFGVAKDTLQFNMTLFSNFTAAMNHASQVGANTVFTIDANDTVTLDNVTKTSLTAGNFHFT